ncbi:MAG TPA: hypothetical protein VF846_02145 [Thermoanaerobaculia bacterium]|jgi:hypothetical protein
MISKSDWTSTNRELTEEARRKLGNPPTEEELEAYSRGELAPEEEERIRELLVAYPELARVMFAAAPDDEAAPSDDDYVSEAELLRRFAAVQSRLRPAPQPARRDSGRVLLFRYVPAGIAAGLALVFAGLYAQEASKARGLSTTLQMPRAASEIRLLQSDRMRGGTGESIGATLSADASSYTLVVPVSGASANIVDYRLEIVDRSTQKRLWVSDTLRAAGADATLSIFLPREFLRPGTYRIRVYGLAGAEANELDTMLFTVPGP